MTGPLEHLDLRSPLPEGLSAVEASAGTGKTYALTALAARGVILGGVRTEELLVVTFTRAATKELRARVRAGLRAAAIALRELATTGTVPDGLDDWLDALCRRDGTADAPPPPPDEAARRAAAAAHALSTLDRATITTLHGFCQTALVGLGLRGTSVGTRFTTEVDRLRKDVVRDGLLTLLATDPTALRRTLGTADDGTPVLEGPHTVEERIDGIVRAVLASNARVTPLGRSDVPLADATARFAEQAVQQLHHRLAAEGDITFDDLVARMHAALDDPRNGTVAVRQLRQRLRLVLVDEMQDTDALQWDIIRRAFLDDPATYGPASDVVIVGDPKQSIYRFRGADIDAYLEATAQAGEQRRSLGSNWRSSEPLLDALDVLMRGAHFGSPRIAYRRVSPGRPVPSRVSADGAPFEVRWIRRDGTLPINKRGTDLLVDPATARTLDDLADRVVTLLRTGRITTDPASDVSDASGTLESPDTRPLAPRDVAVLVRTNAQAAAVVKRLADAGVPAVQPKGGRVYDTDACPQWMLLLAALDRPGDTDVLRALLVSWFVDTDVTDLDDPARLVELQHSVGRWRTLLTGDGMMALHAALRADPVVVAALARAGERGLTDLEHLAELVHVAVGARGVPPAVALRTLEEFRLADSTGEDDSEDPSVRRISTDGDAAHVMTYHGAKGLEFPVVLLPFANRAVQLRGTWTFRSDAGRMVDAMGSHGWNAVEDAGTPPLDAPHATKSARERLARAALAGDEARLLYVALTRAKDRCIVWWWAAGGSSGTPLATMLFGARDDTGALLPDTSAPAAKELDDDRTGALLADLVDRAAGTIGLETVPAASHDLRYEPDDTTGTVAAAVATLPRDVHEPDVWRWSFTGLLRPLSGATRTVADDVPLPPRGGDDEPDVPDTASDVSDATDAAPGAPLPTGALVDLPGGTAFGVLVHEALEVVDLAADLTELHDDLARELTERAARAALDVDVTRLCTGLLDALATPLDPILPGLTLRDFAAPDRRAELVFELPLADTHARVEVAALASAVSDALAPNDPFRTAFASLPDRVDRTRVVGWLTGVVDLALRTSEGRYVIADYKTNRLTNAAGQPAYDAAAMHEAMLHGEYPLQALLYLVGMHRVLDRRLAGYRPDEHLGGVAFLFLRGMAGPDTPLRDGVRDGVCVWQPTTAAVLAADAVLAGRTPDSGRAA